MYDEEAIDLAEEMFLDLVESGASRDQAATMSGLSKFYTPEDIDNLYKLTLSLHRHVTFEEATSFFDDLF